MHFGAAIALFFLKYTTVLNELFYCTKVHINITYDGEINEKLLWG